MYCKRSFYPLCPVLLLLVLIYNVNEFKRLLLGYIVESDFATDVTIGGGVNALVMINEVNLRRVRLVLGWVTVCGQVNHLGM